MPVIEGMRRGYRGFPPTVEMLRAGIEGYRRARAIETRGNFPFTTLKDQLIGTEFAAGDKRFRIMDVRETNIANPVNSLGGVETYSRLLVPGIAAAIASHPFLGSDKKDEADEAATQAMRTAFNMIHMDGQIKGGEGGGRDQMSRKGALYLYEPLGSHYGPRIDIIVDPLEVTNLMKRFDPNKGFFKGGEGWSYNLWDPTDWYPGYSGALSLLAAADASGKRGGFRPLTDDLYLRKMFFPWQMSNEGLNLNSPAEAIIDATSKTFRVTPDHLRAAALGRPRHKHDFDRWIEEGMNNDLIFKPTDGDSMMAWAIASDVLHFGGLAGGVMEGVIGCIPGIPLGNVMSLQYASHDALQEENIKADSSDIEQQFAFPSKEFKAMIHSKLFDSLHIGSTLRQLGQSDSLKYTLQNAAYAERDIKNFDCAAFLREIAIIEHPDADLRAGFRFSDPSRQLLKKIFERQGWWDVRSVGQIGDFLLSPDYFYFATAITPNKWAPLLGIKADNHLLTTESLFVGGSHAVFILQTDCAEIDLNFK